MEKAMMRIIYPIGMMVRNCRGGCLRSECSWYGRLQPSSALLLQLMLASHISPCRMLEPS
eukprot:4088405-Amphidinium_carterae.1